MLFLRPDPCYPLRILAVAQDDAAEQLTSSSSKSAAAAGRANAADAAMWQAAANALATDPAATSVEEGLRMQQGAGEQQEATRQQAAGVTFTAPSAARNNPSDDSQDAITLSSDEEDAPQPVITSSPAQGAGPRLPDRPPPSAHRAAVVRSLAGALLPADRAVQQSSSKGADRAGDSGPLSTSGGPAHAVMAGLGRAAQFVRDIVTGVAAPLQSPTHPGASQVATAAAPPSWVSPDSSGSDDGGDGGGVREQVDIGSGGMTSNSDVDVDVDADVDVEAHTEFYAAADPSSDAREKAGGARACSQPELSARKGVSHSGGLSILEQAQKLPPQQQQHRRQGTVTLQQQDKVCSQPGGGGTITHFLSPSSVAGQSAGAFQVHTSLHSRQLKTMSLKERYGG